MVSSFRVLSSRSASLFLVGALLLVLGCGDLLAKKSAGEQLYRKNCADCHGLDGKGHTIRYMGNPNANLTDSSWKYGGGDSVAIQNVLLQGLVERHPSSLQGLQSSEVKAIAGWVLELRGEVSR